MKKMRGFVLVLLFLAVLSSVVHAASTIDVESIDNRIIFGERASYEVTITNERDSAQTYTVFAPTSGLDWSVITKPRSDETVSVGAGESRTVEVVVEPISKLQAGVYLVGLDITSNQGEKYDEQLKVYVGEPSASGYLPSLRVDVDWGDNIDPREPQSIKLSVNNLNQLDLSGTLVKVLSDIPSLSLEQIVDIPSNGKKIIEFTADIADDQQPKDYFVFFQFEKDGEVITVKEKRITIVPLAIPFTPTIVEDKGFLKTKRTITFTNEGNVRNTQTATIPMSALQRMITLTSPDAHLVKTDEGSMLGWDIELGPGEEVTVIATTTYRVPLVVLLVAGILVFLYIFYRNPLAVTKAASNVMMHEGGVSGLKVTLVVRNLSDKALTDIEIADQIPSIANIEKDVEMGTLKPSNIVRGRKGGVFIKWKLSELEGKEERLISYNIKSKLNIVGTLTLARAKAYFVFGGKKKTSYSNSYRVATEGTDTDS